jgi:hypothetical protein
MMNIVGRRNDEYCWMEKDGWKERDDRSQTLE